jgi:uncharacterized protein YbjT (DUF2867 family)
MKILIIGASQGTGALAVKEALARGHAVTAFSRAPERLAVEHPHLSLVKSDFHDAESVSGAVRGQEAVLLTASPTSMKAFRQNPNYLSQGTGYVISAMQAHRVKRLVVLSAFGVGESLAHSPFFLAKFLIPFVLTASYEDHERQEKLVTASDLDWVIVRPTRLTDGPARRRYVKEASPKPVPNSISRADVADFMVEAATVDAWVRRAVHLGG